MNLSEYQARRGAQIEPTPRATCGRCRKSSNTCYCHVLRPFESPVPFVILQHSYEAKNAIATGRMAHLSVTNSRLLIGRTFMDHPEVIKLLNDQSQRHVLLMPSPAAVPLETFLAEDQSGDPRPPTFWVLDAKWSHVPKLLRWNPHVAALPRVKFTPERPSSFQIRQQPKAACLSTIESMHFVIDRVLAARKIHTTEHRALLDVFRYLVEQQLTFVRTDVPSRHWIAKQKRLARASFTGGR